VSLRWFTCDDGDEYKRVCGWVWGEGWTLGVYQMNEKREIVIFTKPIKLILSVCLLLAVFGCDETSDPEIEDASCTDLRAGLIFGDGDLVCSEIAILAADLDPLVSDSDGFGHSENLKTLVSRLDEKCDDITAEVYCYACLFSLPAGSLIMVTLDSAGTEVTRFINIKTSAEEKLACWADEY